MALTLMDLNVDCIRKVLEYCELSTLSYLADVCTTLRGIIQKDFFPKYNHFSCKFGLNRETPSLKKQIKQIIPYLQKMEINIDCRLKIENYVPFFKCIKSNVNIRDLTLKTTYQLPTDFFETIRSVFERLESLKIQLDFYDDIDLCSMCPNLLHLNIKGSIPFILNAKPWPLLESLTIEENRKIQKETITTFYKHNPQLKNLKLCLSNAKVAIQEVVKFLPNLERWTFYQCYSNLNGFNASFLWNLKKLVDLEILRINADEFNDIVKSLVKCDQLKHLKIEIFRPYEKELFQPIQRDILAIANDLKQLETFHISNCQLNEAFPVDFVKFAPISLKEVHLHGCGVQMTNSLIADVDQQLSIQRKDMPGEEPLKMCVKDSIGLRFPLNRKARRFVQYIACKTFFGPV